MKTVFKTDFLDIKQFRLSYSIVGEGSIVLVIGSHIYYPRTFSAEIYKQYQFIFMDHRGFGKALNPFILDDFSLANLINDVETLRKHLKIDKMILVGHSGHGYLALEYAKKFPDSVSHLVLLALSPYAGDKQIEASNRYFEESVCPDRKLLLQENLKKLDSQIQADPKRAFILRMLAFGPMIWYRVNYDAFALWKGIDVIPEMFDEVWGKLFPALDSTHNLNKLICPVFLGLGRYDYWNPPYLWENYRKYFHRLTIRIFEQSGHTPQLEEPTLFNETFCTWLSDN